MVMTSDKRLLMPYTRKRRLPIVTLRPLRDDSLREARNGSSLAIDTDRTVERMNMLHYALVFFIIALIAALFGFGGIAAGAAEIAKILFFIFAVLFLVSLLVGLFRRSGGP
jgi:uncharacterized membrane protein YtjA (UPF0391 family)